MGKVIVDISMSLDGYTTAADPSLAEPMGTGGERLHAWAFSGNDPRGQEAHAEAIGGVGAIIAGRRTYDHAVAWWGPDGPSGERRLPVMVVCHGPPVDVPENGVYTFVTTGVEDALARARAAAGDRDVAVMGGADVAGQFLRAGMVDELLIHLVPVLLGGGTRLFGVGHDTHISLEPLPTVGTAEATHLRYRVLGASTG